MTARILDGKKIAAEINEETRAALPALAERLGRPPGLAVVIVGSHPASIAYVTNKKKTAAELGFHSRLVELPAETTADALGAEIDALNADPGIDGILLQDPLPAGLDIAPFQERILAQKDVDGFHPANVGRLWSEADGLFPCTPVGVIEMLCRSGIETSGAEAVIIGRSNIVGKPMAALLARKAPGGNATVTICHSRTRDLAAVVRRADIVVAAIGKPLFVRGDWIKPGATVIDVGINRIDAPERKRGWRLVGDVDFDSAAQVAGAITPVPGGVGPLTIALLMQNTLKAARMRAGMPPDEG